VAICSHWRKTGRFPLYETPRLGGVFALSSDFGDVDLSAPFVPAPREEKPEPLPSLESRWRVSEVLEYILSRLPWATPETDGLTGFTPDEIRILGARLAPGSDIERRALAQAVLGRFGPARCQECPGFWIRRDGSLGIAFLAHKPGRYLAFPCPDEMGLIQALRVRDLDAGGSNKYKWVSSSKTGPRPRDPDGTGAPATIYYGPGALHNQQPSQFLLAEGEKKTVVGLSRWAKSGTIGISFAGVDVTRSALGALRRIDPEGKATVDLALDSDMATNPNVTAAAARLVHDLVTNHRNVRLLIWDPRHKGLDDAIFAGSRITHKFFPRVPPGGVPPPGGKPGYTRTQEEVESALRESAQVIERTLGEFFDAAAGQGKFPPTVAAPPPGHGKTHQILSTLGDLLKSGEWPERPDGKPIRLLFSLPTAADVEEKASILSGAPGVAIVRGRCPGNCYRFSDAQRLGTRGHSVAVHACANCKLWHETDTGTPWPGCMGVGGEPGYLGQEALAQSPNTLLVIATQAWALANPGATGGFDGAIVDELDPEAFRETFRVELSDLATWRNELARLASPTDTPGAGFEARRLLAALDGLAADLASASPAEPLGDHSVVEWWDAPRQSEIGESLRFRLLNPRGRRQRYQPLEFERPLDIVGRVKTNVPLRACRAAFEAVVAHQTRIEFRPDGGRSLLFDSRPDALTTLLSKPLLILDATPSPTLLERAFGCPIRVVGQQVDKTAHIVQTVDGGRWTYAQIRRNPNTPGRAIRLVWREIRRNQGVGVAVFGPLELFIRCLVDRSAINPDILQMKTGRAAALAAAFGVSSEALPGAIAETLWPGTKSAVGWPEAHSRATNRFEGMGTLVIFGPGEGLHLASFTEAARRWWRPGDREEGTKVLAHRLMEEHISATIRQTIGRLRGARSATLPRVVLVTTHDVEGLTPTERCTMAELLGAPPPWRDRSRFEGNLRRTIKARQEAAALMDCHSAALANGVGKLGERRLAYVFGLSTRAARTLLHEWRSSRETTARIVENTSLNFNGPERKETVLPPGPLSLTPAKSMPYAPTSARRSVSCNSKPPAATTAIAKHLAHLKKAPPPPRAERSETPDTAKTHPSGSGIPAGKEENATTPAPPIPPPLFHGRTTLDFDVSRAPPVNRPPG
jgi:hypothetical protein